MKIILSLVSFCLITAVASAQNEPIQNRSSLAKTP